METQTVKDLVSACRTAKAVIDSLPDLPPGLTSRSIHIIDTIHELSQEGRVRVGDVSNHLDMTGPSVTKVIGDLEKLGYVKKTPSKTDGRTTYVKLTAAGNRLWDIYVADYFKAVAKRFTHISDDDARTAISIICEVASEMKRTRT